MFDAITRKVLSRIIGGLGAPLTGPLTRYRVIQRDCHKWKCYLITLNLVFIDFWGISRFNILGGLLFKPTLKQNRHFWLLGPNFFHMVFLGPEITCSFRQCLYLPHFMVPEVTNSVGTYHTCILTNLWMPLLFWKVPIQLLSGLFSAWQAGFEAFLEMGTSEGKVPQISVREQPNLAASSVWHKNQF